MQGLTTHPLRAAGRYLSIGVLAASTLVFAQYPPASSTPSSADSGSSTGGWKRVGDAAAQSQAQPNPTLADTANSPSPDYQAGDQNQPPPPGPPQGQPPYQGGYPANGGQQGYPNQSYPPQGNGQPNYAQQAPVPAILNVAAGTFVTVRVNQLLSSDKNQQGDAFSATLAQPLVVNGVVIAEPGQTVGGRVVEAVKAGHIEGVAKLGIQLTDLTLIDGQQIPLHTSLVSRRGPTSVGQDAGTIAGTTALGAAVGAAADWGRGAAIGAGAGAAAGIIGVLVTRGHPSVIYPEQVLTFRVEAPFSVSTEHSPMAFRYVQPGEYDRPVYNQQGPSYGYAAGPYAAVAPPPAYYGYPYPYYGYGYPYYWGPSFSLFLGGGRGRGYWGGGYRFYGPYGHSYAGSGYVHAGGGSVHIGGSAGRHR